MQIPRRGQNLSTEPLQVPSLCANFGRANTANAADGERQKTLRENLGLRDTAGLALDEHFSLKAVGETTAMVRHGEDAKRGAPFLHRRNAQCVSDAEPHLIRSKSVRLSSC